MFNNRIRRIYIFILLASSLVSCTKNYTKFYDDAEDEGLSVFSNNGNNVASCFVDGKPWKTRNRKLSGFPSQQIIYEVEISKQTGSNAKDTLLIEWYGTYENTQYLNGDITLHLAMPSNFSYNDLFSLQGKQIKLDSTNGYFSAGFSGTNLNNEKGSGSIFFHTVFDSLTLQKSQAKLSGLFEANFPSGRFQRGRFDHFITAEQVNF